MTQPPRLRIATSNPHLLETEGGDAYFMLGDTAWELFHRLTLEEIDAYLRVRAGQGFTMIWANLLPEFDGLTAPNRNGHVPFVDLDPTRPSEPYFKFVDEVLGLAQSHGLYVGLLPAWGDKLTAPWGAGPRIFRLDNLDVVGAYAEWLGRRYADHSHVIWVLGGDRPPKLFGAAADFPMRNAVEAGIDPATDWTPIWRTMAARLKGAGASQLMTYHPQGGRMSTSHFIHDEEWLDMNSMQSGHGGGHDVPVWEGIERDYALLPTKPTFDSEPNYEDSPVSPWPVWDPATGFFDDLDVRKQIYRSVFAGGCGAIYGNHCVWQFASELFDPILETRFHWSEAILRPGAATIGNLPKLLRLVDWRAMQPTQSRIAGDVGVGSAHARAMGDDATTLVYVPDGRPLNVALSWARGQRVSVETFDPITGDIAPTNIEVASGAESVTCPGDRRHDRVIVLRCLPPTGEAGPAS